MSYLKSLFATASEFEFLKLRCEFLDSELTKAEAKNTTLEKQIVAERKAKDAVFLRYGDSINRQLNLPTGFVADAQKIETPKVVVDDTAEKERIEAEILYYATQFHNTDIDNGAEVLPIETYIESVRQTGVQNL